MIETAAETVESSGDVLTTLTDIKQLLTFLVVVVVLAIAFFLLKCYIIEHFDQKEQDDLCYHESLR